MNGPGRRLWVAVALAFPNLSWAHSPVPGLGYFYNGALHPLVEPPHAMALVALGLLLGQRAHASGMHAKSLLALAAGLALGLGLSGWVSAGQVAPALLLVLSVVVAIGVVVARPWAGGAVVVASLLIGATLGADSAPERAVGLSRLTTLVGTGVGAFYWCSMVAVLVEMARRPWMLVGVRVVASWVAASALLVLSLSTLGTSVRREAPGRDDRPPLCCTQPLRGIGRPD